MLIRFFLLIMCLFSHSVYADDLVGKEFNAARDKLFNYMDSLHDVEARFSQYVAGSVATGNVIVHYPNVIVVNYSSPREIKITYQKSKPGMVYYQDIKLKQNKYVKTKIQALWLLTEPKLAKAVKVNGISREDDILLANVSYRGEDMEIKFTDNPVLLRAISVDSVVNGAKVRVNFELESLKALN